jgi:hypothetical protein
LVVLEFESARWGFVAFLGLAGRLGVGGMSGGHGFRKGVGRPSDLRAPQLNPQLTSAAYYTAALADPADRLKQAMENAFASGETSFAAAAAYLAPTHEYAVVGNRESHIKFSVAQDGKIWLANFSIYSPTDQVSHFTSNIQSVVSCTHGVSIGSNVFLGMTGVCL